MALFVYLFILKNGNVPRTVFEEGVLGVFWGFNVVIHLMFLSDAHICVWASAARQALITNLLKKQVL